MDTSTLRWILIIVGVVIVGSIFLFGNPDRKRKPKASRRGEGRTGRRRKKGATVRHEPTLDGGGARGASADAGDEAAGGQGELDINSAAGGQRRSAAAAPAGPVPEKIVSLFVLAPDNHLITGAELLKATVSTGMQFGDMNIFHRLHEASEQPIFSLANAAKPGHFERDEWNTFETTGVVLFLTLPGPMHALDAWDSMLATARRVAGILQAQLLDGDRSPFTRQREAQIREEMREYDRGKTKKT